MALVLVWLVVSGLVLFAAANLFSRRTLRTLTVVLLAAGIVTLARVGRSLPTAADKPIREVVLLGAQHAGSRVTEVLGLEKVPLDAAAGGVILVALVFAYRKAEITNARRLPGPVTVRPFERAAVAPVKGDGGPWPDPVAMEARMRQRLADANVLPPPSVPGGTQQQQLVEVIQKSPLADMSGFGRILAFLARAAYPEIGYHVTGTLISENDTGGYGVTVSLNDSISSSTVAVRTFVSRTHEEAVDSAAFFVARELLDRCTTVPDWQQWRDYEALEAYHRGRRAVERRDWNEAETAFSRATLLSPNNVHPYLELAAVYDIRDRCWDTLQTYFTVLRRSPRLIEARYRLAITYSQVASSDRQLLTDAERRRGLSEAIREDLRCRGTTTDAAQRVASANTENAAQLALFDLAALEL